MTSVRQRRSGTTPLALRGEQADVSAVDLTTLRAVIEERIENNGIPAKLYRPPGAEGLLLLGHGGRQERGQ